MFIRDSRRSYRTYSYAELILITDLCAFRTPVGVTELMLMLRSLTYSEVLVGTTEIIERVLYCRTYSDTEVLVSTTELMLILRSIYWSYRTWTCISDLIHVLQSIYLSYGSYTGLTELILVLRILY